MTIIHEPRSWWVRNPTSYVMIGAEIERDVFMFIFVMRIVVI